MTLTKAVRLLEDLYSQVPSLKCQGKCQACCEPFRIGRVEWSRIERQTGPLKVLDRRVCPMLSPEGSCSVHPIRPMLCRLWYTVEVNKCPHGCVPDRWLTEEEARKLLLAANALSRHEFAGPCTEMESLEKQVQAMFQVEGVQWP